MAKSTKNSEPRTLTYIRLDQVEHAPRNPKGHDGASIARSIAHHGLAEIPLRDDRTGRLVAGHGRHEQLVAMHAAGDTAPDGVLVDDDGMWRMPVVTGWSSRSDADAEAYLIGSNQITTAGGWDDGLADVLRDIQASGLLDLTGFTDDAYRELLDGIGGENPFDFAGSGDADSADDTDATPPAEPVTVLGDVWTMGPHRLVCGDSTNQDAWGALLPDGQVLDAVWTDPPYGVAYVGKTSDALTIENDDLDEAGLAALLDGGLGRAAAHTRKGGAWWVAAPPGPLNLIFGNWLHQRGLYRQQIIWVKDQFVMGRSEYHYRHEPIFYGWIPGGAHHEKDDRTQDTVWEIPRPKRSTDHPTMKPVELVARAVTNSTRQGSIVGDPFGGSGTTLLAAQITGRQARLIELDPAYCDVIARRYQELTGELPYNERLGEPVDLIGRQA